MSYRLAPLLSVGAAGLLLVLTPPFGEGRAQVSGPPAEVKVKTRAGAEDAATKKDADRQKAARRRNEEAGRGPRALLLRRAVMLNRNNLKPMTQQLEQQYRPALLVEFRFVRTVCGPTSDQLRPVALEGVRALHATARKAAEWQFRPGQRSGGQARPDPQRDIRHALAAAVKAHLTAEQAARYRDEVAKKDEAHKQAVLRNLVAAIDQELCLSADQRGKILAALSARWSDEWGANLQTFMQGNQPLMRLDDEAVVPSLTEAQKSVWSALPKGQTQFWMGFTGVADNGEQPDPELVEAEKAVAKEAKK